MSKRFLLSPLSESLYLNKQKTSYANSYSKFQLKTANQYPTSCSLLVLSNFNSNRYSTKVPNVPRGLDKQATLSKGEIKLKNNQQDLKQNSFSKQQNVKYSMVAEAKSSTLFIRSATTIATAASTRTNSTINDINNNNKVDNVVAENNNQNQNNNNSNIKNYFQNQNTNNNHSSNSNKKKSESVSESRERLTHLRYFYGDPEIDKAAEKPLVRINPMTMLYMGVSTDNSHLIKSANYLRNELPIRLAHMIRELRTLPFIIACNPAMLEIHERCIKAFRNFDNFEKEITDLNLEKEFNQYVYEMLEMNKDLLVLLCDGFKDSRRYIKDEYFIKTNLNKILSARLGLRLLCEHHMALNKQSYQMFSSSSSSNDDSLDMPLANGNNRLPEQPSNVENSNAPSFNQNDNFNSSYLTSSAESTNTNSHTNVRDEQVIGIIHKNFSPKRLIETSARTVSRLCAEKYGSSPKLKIDGHTNAQFPYLPLPLEYILPELLKNAFRFTHEHHRNSSSLPDVAVTIAVNEKDFVIRIRDRGGGIPHSLVNKIFDYHFTTASDGSASIDKRSTTNQNEPIEMDTNMAGIGMICEASSTRGLAVMHGYGFGLPTSKAYAEYLGGSLTFQSMQGIGTDFYLRLGKLDAEPEIVRI